MSIADDRKQIRDWITNETWPETLVALERNVITWDKEATNELRCYVVPETITLGSGVRQGFDENNRVGIYLLQNIQADDVAAELARQDELVELVRVIQRRISRQEQFNNKPLQMVFGEPRNIADPEALVKHVFVGGFPVTLLEVEQQART